MAIEDILLKVTKQLFPTGRAWKLAKNSIIERLFKALSKSEAELHNFTSSTLDRILADNNEFTADDAALWERRLNIPVEPDGIPLADRKQRILRKYAFPGNKLYRQNYRYLQAELQRAGFDLYVHENRFPDGGGGFTFLNVSQDFIIQHDEELEHGFQSEMGASNLDLIANSADPNEIYSLGTNEKNNKGLFFIGGQNFPDRATLNVSNIESFRKLVLLIKPVATVGVLLIDYVEGGNLNSVSGDNLVSVSGDNLVSVEEV